MIHFDKGVFGFDGDKVELMADIATVIHYFAEHDIFDAEDILKIMTLSLESAGASVYGGVFDSPEEFAEFVENMEDCEDGENYEFCEDRFTCEDSDYFDDGGDDVDGIFDFLKKS